MLNVKSIKESFKQSFEIAKKERWKWSKEKKRKERFETMNNVIKQNISETNQVWSWFLWVVKNSFCFFFVDYRDVMTTFDFLSPIWTFCKLVEWNRFLLIFCILREKKEKRIIMKLQRVVPSLDWCQFLQLDEVLDRLELQVWVLMC